MSGHRVTDSSGRGRSPVDTEHAIAQGLRHMALALPANTAERLAHYLALLERWNRVYNLTAVIHPQEMVVRHILDSLAILPWLLGPRILDVGSGAGLPGIPLAVAQPQMAFYLIDSNAKRTRFMTQAVAELGIHNVHVVHCRVEDYRPEAGFNSVLSRAFASLPAMLASAGRLCTVGGCVLAMKGKRPDNELANIPPNYTVVGVHSLTIPGLDAERHLVHLSPADSAAGVALQMR
jgi:16S rRNA (guanine527-N7)-methyltransferase